MARLYWKPRGFQYKEYAPYQGGQKPSDEDVDRRLDELGVEGWELVTVFAGALIVYVFKRPLPPYGVGVR